MQLVEITLSREDLEFIRNMVDEREEALNTKKRMPALARASAQHEIDVLRRALATEELF
jgi:hypothetical protein